MGVLILLYSFSPLRSERKKIPIVVRLLGINYLQNPINRKKGLAFFQWFYCTKGRGEIILENRKSVVEQGQGFFIYPDIAHAYHGLTDDWTVHIIGFDGPACLEILKSLKMYESGVYHFSNQSIFIKHIQVMICLKNQKNINLHYELSKECYNFLLNLSTVIHRVIAFTSTQENQIVNEVLCYLEDNYKNPITLNELAEQVKLSKEYLCVVFKREIQKTIMQVLMDIRISHARFFLKQYPDKKIWEISEMCGFESPSYFGKKFKEFAGCTPEQYRK